MRERLSPVCERSHGNFGPVNALVKKLLANGPVLTDGAWGTELQVRGLAIGAFPDLWNLTQPQRVAEVARAYVEAGSQIILTNTFGANRFRLRAEHQDDKVEEINIRGVEISREAAGDRVHVFASMGPSGKLLAAGDISPGELREGFAEQAAALAKAGVDAFVLETFSDLEEAKLALEAATQTRLPVVACMVYDSGKHKDRTMMGTTPEQAAEALTQAGAAVIGANCGQGVAGFVPICQRLRAATRAPIWIKANAGLPELAAGQARYQMTPQEFAGHVPELLQAGASFVGGCCGTNPTFVEAMKRCLNQSPNL